MDWGFHILIAIVAGLLIVTFVAQRTIVHGESMEPTLQEGNQLVIEKISPRLGKIKHGDIVTINVPEFVGVQKNTIIKRVIGVENDTVEVKDGKVYVNGVMLDEGYINGKTTLAVKDEYSKVKVPKGYIYVLGDNRLPGASMDSRVIGPLSIKKVSGKAIFRFFPVKEIGKLK